MRFFFSRLGFPVKAILAIGLVGSAEPSYVKDVIPELIDYVAHPEKVKKELDDLRGVDSGTSTFQSPFVDVTVKYIVTSDTDTIAPTWLRDASIDALGAIGKQSPGLVNDAIPLLENLSKDAPEPYTMKKSIRALENIRGNASSKDTLPA